MSEVFVSIPGLDQIHANIAKMGSEIAEKVNLTINRGAERIATSAKQTYCPVNTGNLRATIHVETDSDGVSVVAGGPAADYAVVVHEDLGRVKNWRKPGSGPKYIERPALEEAPRIGEVLQRLV
jgi:hypothetical protein